MTIQSNYPAAKPSLMLDFANTKQLDPRITFTRASTGTYYDGKTATLAEQNLVTSSQSSSPYQNSNNTVTGNAAVAPDRTTTATLIVPSAVTSRHYCSLYTAATAYPSGTTLTASAYVKAAGYNFACIQLAFGSSGGGSRYTVTYDLANGVVRGLTNTSNVSGTSSSITYVGNGWYRVTLTATATTASGGLASMYMHALPYPDVTASADFLPDYAGDGTNGIYSWGGQLETRSTVSAYTPTTSVQITNYIPTLQSAASGVARFDSNPTTGESLGLLIEESRTNLLLASAQFETSPWVASSASIAANAVVGQDGTMTGDVLTSSAVDGNILQTVSVTSGSQYTFSVWARSTTSSNVAAKIGNIAVADMASITVTPNWQRFTVTQTAGGSTRYPKISLEAANTSIVVWGAQLEAGSSATSYVATPLTFTSRASSATYLGPNGYITSAATNVARNQTNSVGTTNLLLESAASNLRTYTDDFANSSWTKDFCSVAINVIQAPDGSMMADKIVPSTASNYHAAYNWAAFTVTAQAYTGSFYVKAAGYNYIKIELNTGGTAAASVFNLSTGVVTSTSAGSAAIQDVGGGWYRCSVTGTATAGNGGIGIFVYDNTGTQTFAGDGVSGVYVFGAQCEAGSTATSYIPSVETWSSRASTATYFNSSGVLTTAASGVARTTYNPALLGAGGKLLLEPAATNLLLYSQAFNNAAWNLFNGTVTANTVVAPDGATTGCTWTVSGTAGSAVYRGALTFTTGTVYTTSCYLKAGTNSYAYVNVQGGSTTYATGVFNLASGSVGQTAVAGSGVVVTSNIESVGNGWYRCSITYVANSAMTIIAIGAAPAATGNSFDSNGNPTGNVNGVTLYTWGAQWETGSGATSYITTTSSTVTRAADASTSAAQSRSADVYSASTVTRAADAASMTGTNFSSWYNQGNYTFYTAVSIPSSLSVFTGDASTFFSMGSGQASARIKLSGVMTAVIDATATLGSTANAVSVSSEARTALSYSQSTYSLCLNNGTVASYSNSSVAQAATQLLIGADSFANKFNVPIKKISFYPVTLTNAQLQALTS